MPARVLSPLVGSDRTFRPSSSRHSRTSSYPHRDELMSTDRLRGNNVPYDVYSHRNVLQHNPLPHPSHLYSLPYVVPSVHHTGSTLIYNPPLVLVQAGPGHLHPSGHGWLPHPPHIPRPPVVPPPPLPQKVWILDCNSCGTFLTNRGMKAVLLLSPNVPLYSTDALPANCSANGLASEPPKQPSREPELQSHNRSCECLTQTLYCHGCGNPVGYMIVTPCHRCTSSTTATNRTTNGHRFVFYSNEISPTERVYVPGEIGVAMFHPNPSMLNTHDRSYATPLGSTASHSRNDRRERSRSVASEFSPSNSSSSFMSSSSGDGGLEDISMLSSPSTASSGFFDDATEPRNLSLPLETRPEAALLKAGENVLWHHLLRSGEIPAVQDDVRARAPKPDVPAKVDMDIPKKSKHRPTTQVKRAFAAAR